MIHCLGHHRCMVVSKTRHFARRSSHLFFFRNIYFVVSIVHSQSWEHVFRSFLKRHTDIPCSYCLYSCFYSTFPRTLKVIDERKVEDGKNGMKKCSSDSHSHSLFSIRYVSCISCVFQSEWLSFPAGSGSLRECVCYRHTGCQSPPFHQRLNNRFCWDALMLLRSHLRHNKRVGVLRRFENVRLFLFTPE